MKNPWLKKNPYLSMWLSGANAVAGAARSYATAAARKQVADLMSEGSRQMGEIWSKALVPPQKKKRKSRGK